MISALGHFGSSAGDQFSFCPALRSLLWGGVVVLGLWVLLPVLGGSIHRFLGGKVLGVCWWSSPISNLQFWSSVLWINLIPTLLYKEVQSSTHVCEVHCTCSHVVCSINVLVCCSCVNNVARRSSLNKYSHERITWCLSWLGDRSFSWDLDQLMFRAD